MYHHYVAQGALGLELLTFLPLSPKCRDAGIGLPYPATLTKFKGQTAFLLFCCFYWEERGLLRIDP